MIDFTNATYVKLAPRDLDDAVNELSDILIEGERVELAFKGARDSVTFTTRFSRGSDIRGPYRLIGQHTL